MNQHDIDRRFSDLSFNARLLLKELARRRIELQPLGAYMVKATRGKHIELLYDIYISLTSYPLGVMIDDKYYTKQLLKKYGYTSTPGQAFMHTQLADALDFADELGYPIVIKPTVGSHGDHVYMDIMDRRELEGKIAIFNKQQTGNGYFLIEKQVPGHEYRLFVTKDGFFAAVQRVPAHVIGDGTRNLSALVEAENFRRMNPRNTCLCEIRLDRVTRDFLKKNKLTLDYVPKQGEKVFLRQNSNVSTGGNCYEVTDQVHPNVVKLAHEILASLDVPFVGIDLLCEDITVELEQYAICELNGAPGLSLHMMPETGPPQNTAGALVDVLFPETKS